MRIATFNCENLFARYNFRRGVDPTQIDGFTINDLAFDLYHETAKKITGKAIREVKADVVALQEVESLPVLDRFNSRYLAPMKYRHRFLVDSHDPRGIDVGILSRYPIVSVRSYRQERNAANTAFLFSRDCLEVELEVEGKSLTIYINHFKSMMGGRDKTEKRRAEQARRVAAIIDERWAQKNYEGNYVVVGDLNDYPEGQTSLASLLNHAGLENVVDRRDEDDRWTHFWAGGNEYHQLDYLFLSQSLAAANPDAPRIMRKGLPYRAEKFEGDRFDNVGENTPKASDHAVLYMDIDLA